MNFMFVYGCIFVGMSTMASLYIIVTLVLDSVDSLLSYGPRCHFLGMRVMSMVGLTN